MLTSALCTRTNVIDGHFGGWFGAQDLPRYHVGKRDQERGIRALESLALDLAACPHLNIFRFLQRHLHQAVVYVTSHITTVVTDAAGILDFDYVLIGILVKKDEQKLRRRS